MKKLLEAIVLIGYLITMFVFGYLIGFLGEEKTFEPTNISDCNKVFQVNTSTEVYVPLEIYKQEILKDFK